jgi:molybdopterin/thiamine biosynthesis adenylyltransferase
MDWVLKNPKRLLHERAEFAALEKESWIKAVVWRMTQAFLLEVDVDMDVHGADFPVTLTYTDLFPETAAYVRPRDRSQLWSNHQYGPGGTLCLEWREDNWHSGVTGADLLRSAYKLLSTERHPEQPRRVLSAHRLTEGQELRSCANYRLVLTAQAASALTAVPNAGTLRFQTIRVSHSHNGPDVAFISQVERAGGLVALPGLPEGLTSFGPLFALADDGHAVRHESFEKASPIASPDELVDGLRRAGFEDELLSACKSASSKYRHHVVLLMGAQRIRAYGVSGGEQPILVEYGLVMPHDSGVRLPAEQSSLASIRIGIVGLGSLGSKTAVSLARSGLRSFLLIDDDVLLPENLCRHELSWAYVGLHKVQGLREELSLVAPNIEAEIFMHRVGGQESAMEAARVVKELACCDLLIDATADPRVFLRLAAVAKANRRPLCWGEVFAGGFGGLIARARPGEDPHPACVRSAILSYCGTLSPAPALEADGYDGSDQRPEIAHDADVAQIASALTRFALDTVLQRESSDFPYAAYLIGMRKEWIFEEPFDTRPIKVIGEGWGVEQGDAATDADRAEALRALLAMVQVGDAKSDSSS